MPLGKPIPVEAVEIVGAPNLDPIQVVWRNYAPCQGSVTITCWGCAWTAYFGGMGAETIEEFFADADTPYLVTKLGITPLLKQSKKNAAYLGRIIDAIKQHLAETAR
jgi:hypothetical protein